MPMYSLGTVSGAESCAECGDDVSVAKDAITFVVRRDGEAMCSTCAPADHQREADAMNSGADTLERATDYVGRRAKPAAATAAMATKPPAAPAPEVDESDFRICLSPANYKTKCAFCQAPLKFWSDTASVVTVDDHELCASCATVRAPKLAKQAKRMSGNREKLATLPVY